MKDIRNYSLLQHNTFGIDACCSRYLEYGSVEDAKEIAHILRREQKPFIIIGGGSNLLLTKDFEGIVVRSAIASPNLPKREGLPTDSVLVRCGSGEKFDDVVANCVKHGWYGAENLSHIPGDVGASAVQNIGAYGVEVCQLIDTIEAVEIATGELKTIKAEACGYGYRQSRFKQEWKNKYLITFVTYRLSKTFQPHLDYGNIRSELERRSITEPTPEQLRRVIIDIRSAKLPDPKEQGNAGSFFMNPIVSRAKYEELANQYDLMPHYYIDKEHEKIPAGWLIDQCGWKGKSLGRAGVHDKQALVLVNRGGATGEEIVALCRQIQQDVKGKFDIDIFPEVNIV